MESTHGQRALVFDFDTIQQRALWESLRPGAISEFELPPASLTHRFAGLLRTADVLTKSIVLPDVQLLDGSLFLHHGPEIVRSLLGRSIQDSMNIQIVGRAASLAECLRKMVLGSKDSDTLAVFEFSSLAVFSVNPGELGRGVSQRSSVRLRGCPSDEVANVVAAEFQAAHDNVAYVEMPTGIFLTMANRWNAWISASDWEREEVQVWDSNRFSLARAFDRREVPAEISVLVESDDSVSSAVEELKMIRGRSSLKARVKALESELPTGVAGIMDAWWSSAYFDALAEQHRCSWIRLESSSQEAANMRVSSARGTLTIEFEGRLIGILSEMPSATYASAKYSARDAIAKWAESPVSRNSDGLAFAVLKFNETIDLQDTRRSLWRQVILTLVPAILGAVIGHYVSTAAGIWALALTAAGILLAAPLGDLLELHALRRKQMQSIINMPGLDRG